MWRLAGAAFAQEWAITSPTVEAYTRLCHDEVPWHCLEPMAGQRLLVVTFSLGGPWTADLQSVRFEPGQYGLEVDGVVQQRIAKASLALVADVPETLHLFRPYRWEDHATDTFSWVFSVPEGATSATLRVGPASASLDLPAETSAAPDPRRFLTAEVTYARVLGTEIRRETTIGGVKVVDYAMPGCTILELGAQVRVLGATSATSSTYTLHTRELTLRVPGLGHVRPLEALEGVWPKREDSVYVRDGSAEATTVRYCVPEGTTSGELLFREAVVDTFAVEGAAPPPPPPPPPKGGKKGR